MPIKLLETRPLPETSVSILRDVSIAANQAGAAWFVGGATARDILTTHRFGIEQSRATADVDIGVCIASWQGDRELRDALIRTGRFEPSNEAQRLYYIAPNSGERMWLDIVPFGGLERQGEREIEWPPDGAFRMNVAGFSEALEAAVEVELADDIVALVAPLPALAMLKILAWRDRHTAHARDATDLRFLMAEYANAGNNDRLYDGDALDLLEAHGFDPNAAGAALLARDMAPLVARAIRPLILEALVPGEAYPPIAQPDAWRGTPDAAARWRKPWCDRGPVQCFSHYARAGVRGRYLKNQATEKSRSTRFPEAYLAISATADGAA